MTYSLVAAMLDDKQTFKMAARKGDFLDNIQFSDYFESLDGPAKERYREKVVVCGFDPYALKTSDYSEDIALLPNI